MAKIMTLIVALLVPSLAAACSEKVELLAKNIYYEARGEGSRGMRLVADVTLNRVNAKGFPNNVCAVIRQSGQFSWVGKVKGSPKGDSWEQALDIAEAAIDEGPKLTTALYFRRGGGDSWQNRSRKLKHKNHSFY